MKSVSVNKLNDDKIIILGLLKKENLSELDGVWVAGNEESQENCSAVKL